VNIIEGSAMKKIISLSFFILFLSVINLYAVEIMPLDQIKHGMKGYALTVVRGTEPIRFDVEIIDVLRNVSPKRSMILAKFSGDDINKTGIAQGMSGSPVYINGKLIGALAYTWGFLKEPIGGIQPIEQMLSVMEREDTGKKEPFEFIPLDDKLAKELKIETEKKQSFNRTEIKPIATPLMISGFTPEVFSFFKEKFEKLGFSVIQGSGNGQAKSSGGSELNPGDAVGINMVSGDANIAAIGTVSYKENDRVLIFGHPFMERGFTQMPMSKAFVHYVLPSLQISWKFASSSDIIGTVYNDRDTAVAGAIGKAPYTLPVTVNWNSKGKKTVYQYQMTPDPLFFPNLFAGILMSTVFAQDAKQSEGSIALKFNLKVRNKATGELHQIRLEDFFIGTDKMAMYQAMFRMIFPIQYLIYNWFDDIQLEDIEVDLNKKSHYQVAAIDKAVILNDEVRPGDTLRLRLFLRLYRGGYIDKMIEFPVPPNLNTDILYVNISSAKIENLTSMYRYTPKFTPKSFAQLLDILRMNASFNDLSVWVDIPQTSVVVDGFFLPNLPISKMANYAFRVRGNDFLPSRRNVQNITTNYMISGYLNVPVKIKLEK
jgi:hypothetical protein